jgi:hypothetical protein
LPTTNKWQFLLKYLHFSTKRVWHHLFFFNEFWPFGDKKGDANYPKDFFLENAHLVTRFQGGKKVELTIFKA